MECLTVYDLINRKLPPKNGVCKRVDGGQYFGVYMKICKITENTYNVIFTKKEVSFIKNFSELCMYSPKEAVSLLLKQGFNNLINLLAKKEF